MRALTVRQPWAALIVHGVKWIETRPRRFPPALIGARIAIHAGAHRPVTGDDVGDWWWEDNPGDPECIVRSDNISDTRPAPLGAIVGYATITKSVPIVNPYADDYPFEDDEPGIDNTGDGQLVYWPFGDVEGSEIDCTDQLPYGDYTPGRYGWILTDPEPCDPIPTRGQLGLWTWKGGDT